MITTNCSEFAAKMNGHQARHTLTLLIITSGELRLNVTLQGTFYPKPKNTDGLKNVLQLTWGQLPQDSINKDIPPITQARYFL